jgi:hypothetical protein
MEELTYKILQKKETLKDGEKEVLFFNISYPSFESEKNESAKKLNEFYKKGAEEFEKYCRTGLFQKAKREKTKEKYGALMKSFISFCDNRYLSCITDVSFFDGIERKSARFVDNWTFSGQYPEQLRPSEIFDVSSKAKKLYTDEICSKIMTSGGEFSYFPDAVFKAKRKFDENKFYLTAKGVAFYYDKDLLFPEKEGTPSFVIPYSEIKNLF